MQCYYVYIEPFGRSLYDTPLHLSLSLSRCHRYQMAIFSLFESF